MARSPRKRINLSVKPDCYAGLEKTAKRLGYKNPCCLVTCIVNIFLDRLESADNRRYELVEEDGAYIDAMFSDMANSTRQADGDGGVAITRRNRKQ